jgi:ADP-heptose:LPS heptosyltransferase
MSEKANKTQKLAGGLLGQIEDGSRVALIRLRSLGDCVLTTPAIQILKSWRPDLRLAVVVEERFAAVFEGNPCLERVIAPSCQALRAWHPAVCVNLHGGTRSMMLTLASGARQRVGFAHHQGAWLYTARIPRAQQILGEERVVHTAEHLASAMFWMGCPRVEIPRASLPAATGVPGGAHAVIHASAAASYKTWNPAGFRAVAEHLQRRWDLEPVFIGASSDSFEEFRAYRVLAGAPLREVMQCIAAARIFVGNDSGPAHIAAATGVPLVVLYGRLEHSVIWAPWRAERARSLASPEGIHGIKTADVVSAVDDLLSGWS